MALIVCPECGKQISDQAAACIHCGYPIPKECDNLIICGKDSNSFHKPTYYLYDEEGNLFDSILAGERKSFRIDKPITLILGHKRGSFAGSALQDSRPTYIDPKKVTCLEASISPGLFNKEYRLTPIK